VRVRLSALWLAVVVLAAGMPCQAQDGAVNGGGDSIGFSPWQQGWYEDRGIELPLPFGIAFLTVVSGSCRF